jgi:hypothetical protein
MNYIMSNVYSGNPRTDHRVVLQFNLRTLGGTAFSQTVSSTPNGL